MDSKSKGKIMKLPLIPIHIVTTGTLKKNAQKIKVETQRLTNRETEQHLQTITKLSMLNETLFKKLRKR
jgi:uncharacterized protein YigA (DUF484 family)